MAVTAGGGSYSTAAGRAANARAVAGMSTNASTKRFAAPAKMKPLPKKKVVTPKAAAVTRRAVSKPIRASRTGNNQSAAPEAAYAPPEPGPIAEPMTDEQYLGTDEGYQGQLAQFQKTLTDFLADKQRRSGIIQGDYDTAVRSWGTNRDKGKADLTNDYAARGLLRSGLYDTAQTDFEKQMQDQMAMLNTNRTTGLSGLEQEQTSLSSEQELAKAQARQDALNRRAQLLAAGL